MGLFSRKPKIKIQTSKKDGFSGWLKCSRCHEMIHAQELEENLNCCPKCDFHYRISVDLRIDLLADKGSFQEMYGNIESSDPLNFEDTLSYQERLKEAKEKSGKTDAIVVGTCTMDGQAVALGVMDFSFMGGSMGSVVGERLTLLIEYAIAHRLPLVVVSASGGARMQESILSLMQMAKTSAALAKLDEAGLPYISLLTNPTSGGVTASFASLGDIILAEPDALICFSGPRVIEQTINLKLPEGAQRSEFLLNHGMIDCIVKRGEIKSKISNFIDMLMNNRRDFKSDISTLESWLQRQPKMSSPKSSKEKVLQG